jgi:phospholipid/cholesterol/gamma-HCH transport system substrate-binding protein
MKNTLETRLGIFVALVVIAAVMILEMVGTTEQFRRGKHLYAQFNNVQDLKIGDRVKLAGKDVGRVDEVRLQETNNKVLVRMKIDPKVLVRTDSTAAIRFTGLMGQSYVALDFGSPNGTPAAEGTYLEATEATDLSTIMVKIDKVATGVEKLTGSFTGEKIDNLLGPFTDFLKANKGPLTATIANLQTISGEIAEGKGSAGKLVNDPALYHAALSAVTNFQDTATEVKAAVADARKAVDQARQIVAQANAGQGTVGKLLKEDTLYREVTASATNLKEILQKINQGDGAVGKLVNDRELYNNAKLTLQKLDKATEGLEDQGPLSVMGLMLNKLF